MAADAPRVVKSENTKWFFSFTSNVPCEYFVIIIGYFCFSCFWIQIVCAQMIVNSLFREYCVLFLIVPIIVVICRTTTISEPDEIIIILRWSRDVQYNTP